MHCCQAARVERGTMRLSVVTFLRPGTEPRDRPLGRIVDYARRLEKRGFPGIWVTDSLGRTSARRNSGGIEMGRKRSAGDEPELAAGNGLLDRRALLAAGASLGGAGVIVARPAFGAAELSVEPWMTEPGAPFTGYGQPSRFEAKVVRTFASAPGTTGTGASRTPLQRLNGTITPNGLHFERHHSGIPDIDPDAHRLLIHGLVKRPLVFTLEEIGRAHV